MDKIIPDTQPPDPLSILMDYPKSRTYRLASWACLLTAIAHTIAVVIAIYIMRNGQLGDFSPIKLLQFVPDNIVIWRTGLVFASIASLTFIIFAVAMREICDRKVQVIVSIAIIFAAIAAQSAINAQFSMMVLFADIACQSRSQIVLFHTQGAELAWALMDHALMQSFLIATGLNALSGLTILLGMFFTRSLPRWLIWCGCPIWIAALGVSFMAFVGELQWALMLSFAGIIAFVLWSMTTGLILRYLEPST